MIEAYRRGRSSLATKKSKSAGEMKILSVRQPWAYLIVLGKKDVENRQRGTKYKGRLAIHATRTIASEEELHNVFEEYGVTIKPDKLFYSAIIGSVDLVDCVTESDSKWFDGTFGLVMRKAKAYKKPVPTKGQLGMFTRPDLAAAIRRQERG